MRSCNSIGRQVYATYRDIIKRPSRDRGSLRDIIGIS